MTMVRLLRRYSTLALVASLQIFQTLQTLEIIQHLMLSIHGILETVKLLQRRRQLISIVQLVITRLH